LATHQKPVGGRVVYSDLESIREKKLAIRYWQAHRNSP